MGHLRLGTLPTSKHWKEVVSLIPQPSSTPSQIAGATIEAAKGGVKRAASDNGVVDTFWLLTQIPLAARQENFSVALHQLGLSVPDSPTAFDVLGALAQAIEQNGVARRERSDFSEIALAAAQQALSELCIEETRSLFAASPEDVKNSFRKYSTSNQFRRLARVFFTSFTARYLKTFLSRELSNHVGATEKFEGVHQHSEFDARQQNLVREIFETGRWLTSATDRCPPRTSSTVPVSESSPPENGMTDNGSAPNAPKRIKNVNGT